MWIVATYEATAFFSLKPASATSSGGRTLLVPTPFAIKMALLDAACRVEGVSRANEIMTWLSPARVAVRPPERVVVNNTFIKILRPRRNPAKPGSADAGFFQRTIAYREYAQFADDFAIALETDDEQQAVLLQRWLMSINYLGKRGSFVQVQDVPDKWDDLPEPFIVVDGSIGSQFDIDSVMMQLDDTSPELTFTQANIYSTGSGSTIRLGKDRLLRQVVLPYRRVSSSRGYTYYEMSSNGASDV